MADGEERVRGEPGVVPCGEEHRIGTSLIPEVTQSPLPPGVSGGQESGVMFFQAMCDKLLRKMDEQINKIGEEMEKYE